jgi:Uma2 family endonuclease
MKIAPGGPMSVEAFLLWEERQESRWEFDGMAPVAWTGDTAEHSAIQRNVLVAVGGRPRGKRCQVFTADLKIAVAGSIRYPDAFVVCSQVPRGTRVMTEPVVVFEVLSPTTASTDIGVKNQEYRDTPSVQRYVMLSQDDQRATVFAREGDDWVGRIVMGDAVLEMPEIGVEVPLAELYEGVSFVGFGGGEVGDVR